MKFFQTYHLFRNPVQKNSIEVGNEKKKGKRPKQISIPQKQVFIYDKYHFICVVYPKIEEIILFSFLLCKKK